MMQYRTLGRTGISVSEIGLGTLAIGGPFTIGNYSMGRGNVFDNNSIKLINVALSGGINFIDTADIYGYGKSEEIIAKAIENKRDKIIISTKAGNKGDQEAWYKDFSYKWIKKACENSLKRLKTDYIDIYLMHSPDVDFRFTEESFKAFYDLKKEGKIRFYGCSTVSTKQAIDYINSGYGDVLEIEYNICSREADSEVFALAEHTDMGIIVKSPLCSGLLTGKYNKNSFFQEDDFRKTIYPRKRLSEIINVVDFIKPIAKNLDLTLSQLALKFCLHRKEVSTVIPGAKSAGQILENIRSSNSVLLPVSVLENIESNIKRKC